MKIVRQKQQDLLHTPVEELLALDLERVRTVLVSWLRRELERTGLDGVVVGLSGGIDSALSAAIAGEALGPDRVLGVTMPSSVSSEQSRIDAERIADHLGMALESRSIGPMVEGYFQQEGDAISRGRRGNFQARARMAVLYDLSARDGRLVLGTSNKSEILLGYSTIFGDGAYAINPIGDLYKTQVRGLAALLGLPEFILDKAPTADLWEGQTDEDELGFTYADADRILFLMVDHRYRPEELIDAGLDRNLISRVRELVRRNQFKRRLPLWPKISTRTVPIDFRYLRDWGT